MIGCDCAVCTSTDSRDKRTRCSVVIKYGGTQVLVDTSPELRLQAVANGIKRIDAVVYTHAHADHIMGLDDVRRFNSLLNDGRGGPLDVWATETAFQQIQRGFGYAFHKPDPEVMLFRPHLVPRTIEPFKAFSIGGVDWLPLPLVHGKVEVMGLRVGNLAYCTDVNFIPPGTMERLQGLDVLILDALQWKKHVTHFTVDEALEVVGKLKPKRAYFTHIAHGLGHVETSKLLPENVFLAFDGLRIQVG